MRELDEIINKEDLYTALDVVLKIGEIDSDYVMHCNIISREIMKIIKQMPLGEMEAVVKW